MAILSKRWKERKKPNSNNEAYNKGYEDGYNDSVERFIEIERDKDKLTKIYSMSTFTNILM